MSMNFLTVQYLQAIFDAILDASGTTVRTYCTQTALDAENYFVFVFRVLGEVVIQ